MLTLAAGPERSRWEEFTPQGDSLLTERGTLARTSLEAGWRCGALAWRAEWAHSQGRRDYDGQTNTGVPVQTTSRLRVDALTLSTFLPVNNAWAVGGRVGWRQTHRDMASTPRALGYPERFRAWQLALGARWHLHDAGHWRLSATGWAGGGPGGSMRASLPRADPLTLPLGTSRLLALGLHLEGGEPGDTRPGWAWQARLDAQRETTEAGAARAVTRNGVPMASARQPRSLQQQLSLTAGATWRF